MSAYLRSILCAAEFSLEYATGARAAQLGIPAKKCPFPHGSKASMRWVYGYADQIRLMQRPNPSSHPAGSSDEASHPRKS